MQGEVWKDIPGYEGFYQASNMGQVRSLPRVVDTPRGPWRLGGKLLKPGANRLGYRYVVLRRNGRSETRYLHRLVGETFIGPLPAGAHTRHLDGNPGNNAAENLAYGTASENQLDLYVYRGYHHKLTVEDVRAIRNRLERGETPTEIARDYPVTASCVQEIKARRCYRWLS